MNDLLIILFSQIKENTIQLANCIEEERIEPALELMERRLFFLESLKKIADDTPSFQSEIRQFAIELVPIEEQFSLMLLKQKNVVAEKLIFLTKTIKAESVYRGI